MRKTRFVLVAAAVAAFALGFGSSAVAGSAPLPPPVAYEPFPELTKATNPPGTTAAVYNLTATLKGTDPATQKAWTFTAPLYAMHSIVAPRDPQSGMATGRRIHKPVQFVLGMDASMPALYGGRLQAVEVVYTPVDPNAKLPTHKFTISGLTVLGQQPLKEFGGLRNKELLEFQLTFQKIVYEWKQGGVSGTDDWSTP